MEREAVRAAITAAHTATEARLPGGMRLDALTAQVARKADAAMFDALERRVVVLEKRAGV